MAKTAFFQATPQHEFVLGIGATKCLNKFDDYLLRVKGVAPGTRKTYCFWVRRFLAAFCGPVGPDWSTLRGTDLAMFVRNEASRLKRNGRGVPGIAMRAFVRYLILLGIAQGGLQGAIPQRPRWRHVGMPRYLPPADIDRVVAGALTARPEDSVTTRSFCCPRGPVCAPTKLPSFHSTTSTGGKGLSTSGQKNPIGLVGDRMRLQIFALAVTATTSLVGSPLIGAEEAPLTWPHPLRYPSQYPHRLRQACARG